MKPRTMICGVAIVACLAFALPTQETRQDESAKKIDALTRTLDVEKRRTTDLERRMTEAERRLDRLDNWFRLMRQASYVLDTAANDARIAGFEQAGPNAMARTFILEGLKGFAAEITKNIPAGPESVILVPR